MKKLLKVCMFILFITTTLTFISCNKEEEVQMNFPEIVSNVKSYKLTGKLESFFPTGTKECQVCVYYQKPNNFRVELVNAGNNEPQIMIKNNDGVSVLLPAVNKVFKINSSFPDNSSYPYILQSLSKDIISDDTLTKTVENGTTLLEFKAKLFDNAMTLKQKVTFDNETSLPKEVLVYDEEDTLVTKFVFNNIELNVNFDSNLFRVNESMSASRLVYAEDPISFDRVISYPTYFPENTVLDLENVSGIGDSRRVVMKYSGDSPFTVIQQYVTDSEVLKTEYLSGDIYTMGGALCILSNNTVFFYDGGIEYHVASNTLAYQTMILMGESMRMSNVK